MKNKYACSHVNTSTHTKNNHFPNSHANKNLSRHTQTESYHGPQQIQSGKPSWSKKYQALKRLL